MIRRSGHRAALFVHAAAFALTLSAALASPRPAAAQEPEPTKATAEATPRADAHIAGRYRIGAGDVLDIRVINRPALTRESVRVDDGGTIQMPWLDRQVRATCRTERELAEELALLYRRFLRSPQVDVFIREYHSKPVAVIGAVNSPGRFQLQRQIRLLDLLTFVNGPAERAGRTVQIIHADTLADCEPADGAEAGDPSEEVIAGEGAGGPVSSLPLADVLRGAATANPYVRPGDIVAVLDAEQVYVIGNVIKPSPLPLRETLTVSQAIAMSGGLLPDSKKDKIRIIRQSPGGRRELFVDLKAIEKKQAEDVALLANDIVEVHTSNTGGKKVLRGILGSFFPTVGQLPVRVIR